MPKDNLNPLGGRPIVPASWRVVGPDAQTPGAAAVIAEAADEINGFVERQRRQLATSTITTHRARYIGDTIEVDFHSHAGEERITLTPYVGGLAVGGEGPDAPPAPEEQPPPLVERRAKYLLVLYAKDKVAAFDMDTIAVKDGKASASLFYAGTAKGSDFIGEAPADGSQFDYAPCVLVGQYGFAKVAVILTGYDLTGKTVATTLMMSTPAISDTLATKAARTVLPVVNTDGRTIFTPLDTFTAPQGKLAAGGTGGEITTLSTGAYAIGSDGTYYYTAGFGTNGGYGVGVNASGLPKAANDALTKRIDGLKLASTAVRQIAGYGIIEQYKGPSYLPAVFPGGYSVILATTSGVASIQKIDAQGVTAKGQAGGTATIDSYTYAAKGIAYYSLAGSTLDATLGPGTTDFGGTLSLPFYSPSTPDMPGDTIAIRPLTVNAADTSTAALTQSKADYLPQTLWSLIEREFPNPGSLDAKIVSYGPAQFSSFYGNFSIDGLGTYADALKTMQDAVKAEAPAGASIITTKGGAAVDTAMEMHHSEQGNTPKSQLPDVVYTNHASLGFDGITVTDDSITLYAFPPWLEAVPKNGIGRQFYATDAVNATPYEKLDASYMPWMHVSNGFHYLQAVYTGDASDKTSITRKGHIWLDGGEFMSFLTTTLTTQAATVTEHDIRACYMDIDLAVIQALSKIILGVAMATSTSTGGGGILSGLKGIG